MRRPCSFTTCVLTSVVDKKYYTVKHDNQIRCNTMKLPLKEQVRANYLYIDPDNIVHVLMPVVSGIRIGLDNTCQAVYSLQEFFDKGNRSKKRNSLKNELLAYKEALKSDLSLLEAHALLAQQKQERLTQINTYLAVITQLEKHSELECLSQNYPTYPRPLEDLMQNRATSNLYSMVLRPSTEDTHLRSEAANPTFSVAHGSMARDRHTSVSQLQQALIGAYAPLRYESQNLKSQVIQRVLTDLPKPHVPVNFANLQQILTNTVQALLNESIDFTQTQQRTTMTQESIDMSMGLNASTSTPTEYIDSLLGYCALNLFDGKVEPPFNVLTTAEGWSIATQFLFGIANIYGVSHKKLESSTNFGQILDDTPLLSQELAQTLAKAQKANHSIEDVALSWMNAHTQQLQLQTPFNSNDVATIKKIFSEHYAQIKESQHFDEFFILDTQNKGSFFTHQGSICASFAEFSSSPLLDLPQPLKEALEQARNQASRLNPEIPHENSGVQGEVEVDTTVMSNIELQALYERIKTEKQLLEQLKQERPDFKPHIYAKQFLQHVAYGEQDEAEALLQEDPELAQELLKANNIPFTDYSGRTFTCTAYEYAYWAGDSHMQRMLEKYILKNEETRQFILHRVQAIETLLSPPANGMFEHPKPRGLQYTTHDKRGQTIAHNEAHFDLTPLKKALTHYVHEYDKKFNKTKADWEVLNKIWTEEVGRAQRDIPAHIAHEYCHPNRSFKDVNQDKALLNASNPGNLKRQLKFYNFETSNNDVWFARDSYDRDSGLGFSFGIMRGEVQRALAGRDAIASCVTGGRTADLDLAVLKTIDEVRSNDRKQSLLNLSQTPNLKTGQSHSI